VLRALTPSAVPRPPTPQQQDLSHKPPITSCRAGAVVHLLRSNGSKVSVTLQLSQRKDGDHLLHVVRISPSSDAARLDIQRIVLDVDQGGRVSRVSLGTTKTVFGFEPEVSKGGPCSRGRQEADFIVLLLPASRLARAKQDMHVHKIR
jgi:hypothetical protein